MLRMSDTSSVDGMEFNHSGRVGLAAAIGLAIVMPLLYFTADHSMVVATANAVEQVAAAANEAVHEILPPKPVEYFEVLESCAEHYEGACVNVRTGPGTEYPAVATLRTGVVLRIEKTVHTDERDWYKVTFDEWVRYPDRIAKEWFVAADIVHKFEHAPPEVLEEGAPPVTEKRILVDRSEQKLYAYENDVLFMEENISSGLDGTPTPRGNFKIFSKMPSRYMQGPVPGITTDDDVYDLPGVPWTMYFTHEGGAIHGAYWHDSFGQQWSHGCVNLPPQKAKELYEWADIGTPVTVRD